MFDDGEDVDIETIRHGVKMNAPPVEALPSIMNAMNKALATLPEGATGAFVGVVEKDPLTGKLTANAAIVTRLPLDVDGVLWVSKDWKAGVSYGAAIRKVW